MRKFFILIVSIFLLSFTANVLSECPRGYSEIVLTVTVNGCDYYVDLCYHCTESEGHNREMRVFGFNPVDPNCLPGLNQNEILKEIYKQVYTPQQFQDLCSSLPGCNGNNGVDVYFVYNKCWRKYNNNGIIEYWVCPDRECYCFNIQTWCWGNGWILQHETGYMFTCSEDCTTVFTSVPDPDVGQWSECFYLWTPCQ